jgi:hypothetical protein
MNIELKVSVKQSAIPPVILQRIRRMLSALQNICDTTIAFVNDESMDAPEREEHYPNIEAAQKDILNKYRQNKPFKPL